MSGKDRDDAPGARSGVSKARIREAPPAHEEVGARFRYYRFTPEQIFGWHAMA